MLGDAAQYLTAVGAVRAPEAALSLAAAHCLRVLRPKGLVRLRAPMGLTVYATADMVEQVIRNALHVFYHVDYEAFPGFRPQRGWVVVDAGAFVGLYTLRAARLVGPGGLVVSAEPLPETYRLLELNVVANKLRNVRLLGACLAGSWGFADLMVPGSPINATLKPEYAKLLGSSSRRVRVRTVPLDAILAPLGGADLLKLDIEGAELEVVKGSRLLRPGVVERVVVEAHPPVTKPSEISRVLEDRGYSTAVVLPEGVEHQAFVYAF